jgi:hypothetical protein
MEKPMAPDERDRSFDKALSRHLRSTLGGEACPDAETLAAYHERSLLPAELNSWKEHIAGCGHCQAILAQLEATDEIPLQAAAKEEVLAMKESELAIDAESLEALPAAAATRQHEAVAVRPKKSRDVRLYGGPRWKWLAPAGALAAGLLVWIALHENPQPQLLSHNEIKVAKIEEPATPAPSVDGRASASLPTEQSTRSSTPRSIMNESASANARAESKGLKQREKFDSAAKVVPSKPPSDKESGARKDIESDASAYALRTTNPADLDAKVASRTLPETVEVQAPTQTQVANDQLQNQYNTNSPKPPGPAALGQVESKKKMMKSAQPAPPPGAVSGFAGATALEMVAASNPRLIAAPGSKIIWRAGRAGLIEFSSDGGASWSRQTSGVLADLLTGSAPSNKICWMVGRVGAILLTTDGGAHWNVIHAPVGEDLSGVRAADALHATIWNSRNTKTFETSDGGLTWKPVPKP